jgi:hypothetical protein
VYVAFFVELLEAIAVVTEADTDVETGLDVCDPAAVCAVVSTISPPDGVLTVLGSVISFGKLEEELPLSLLALLAVVLAAALLALDEVAQ